MEEQLEWAPRAAESVLVAGAGVVLCAVALTADTAGRLLALLAGIGLLGLAAADVLARPRLRADTTGLTARTLVSRTTLAWPQVRSVRVDERHGVAVRSKLLEIDAEDTIILLSRRALGADPHEVAEALSDLRGATR